MLNLNKKIVGLSVLVLFAVSVFCYASTNAGQINIPNCPKEKGYTQVLINKVLKYAECYNPTTGLSYQEKNNSLKGNLFYNQGKYCGLGCDLEGKNCAQGVCNVLDCPKEKGYTEVYNLYKDAIKLMFKK